MDYTYLHLSLNHVPILGTVFGFLLLLGGVLTRSKGVTRAGLISLFLAAVLAIPVYLTGEPAEEVAERLPGVTDAVIELHESAAGFALTLVITTGIAAAAAFAFSKSFPSRLPFYMAIGTLVLAFATGGSMLQTANLGGQIRHTEIRTGASQNTGTGAEARTDKKKKEKEDDDD